MAMMICSSTEFDKELSRYISVNQTEAKVIDIQRGRSNKLEIPEHIRKEVATVALTSDKTGLEIAKQFGISPSSVSAYKVGATSCTSYDSPDPALLTHVEEVKGEITDGARNALRIALSEMTSDKIGGAKIKDIASIAKDMSSVIRNMEPQGGIGIQLNNQVIVYRPKLRDESEFDVITVND